MDNDNTKINWRTILLGLLLNILVIVVFLLLYHAYVIRPRMDTTIHVPEISLPGENAEVETKP